MCEVCEVGIITEAILCLFLIGVLAMTPIVTQFVWVYFLIGFLVFLMETKFAMTRFFFGPYFLFEVGIFLFLYPLILFEHALLYYVGGDIVADCPECGHENWDCLMKKGKIYGKCEKCGVEFIK